MAGVCVVDRARAIDQSAAGASARQQMAQFARGVKAEIEAERAAIVADDQALGARKASLPAADYQRRVAQLQARYRGLDETRDARQAQLAATGRAGADLIGRAIDGALIQAAATRRCGLVLDRGSAVAFAAPMDITPAVIERLNAVLPEVSLRLAPPPR